MRHVADPDPADCLAADPPSPVNVATFEGSPDGQDCMDVRQAALWRDGQAGNRKPAGSMPADVSLHHPMGEPSAAVPGRECPKAVRPYIQRIAKQVIGAPYISPVRTAL